jgi:hypothetical protein
MLLMDYVPNISVTKHVICDLCIGKSIPGKVRIFHFPKLTNQEEIMEKIQQKIVIGDYYDGTEPEIEDILHKYGVDHVVQSQDRNYHLYNNNCMDFSARLVRGRKLSNY